MAFLSTLSLRRATSLIAFASMPKLVFLSTLSLRRATKSRTAGAQEEIFLSTLSLRRATRKQRAYNVTGTNFYPRSPCGERPIVVRKLHKALKFLSTLSLRRATVVSVDYSTPGWDFYPRSPCGERPLQRILPGPR